MAKRTRGNTARQFRGNTLKRNLGIVCMLLMVILTHLFCSHTSPCYANYRCFQYHESYQGIVKDIYLDHNYKDLPRIAIKNSFTKEVSLFGVYGFDTLGIYKVVQVGDSLVKPKESLEFTVYRLDSVLTYNLMWDCCRTDNSGCTP